MLMLDRAVGEEACQMSATPGIPFARVTRVQVRLPPLIVRLWPPATGPAAVANAMTRSPAAVLNGPADTVLVPSANTTVPTTRLDGGGVARVVNVKSPDVAVLPDASVARTR